MTDKHTQDDIDKVFARLAEFAKTQPNLLRELIKGDETPFEGAVKICAATCVFIEVFADYAEIWSKNDGYEKKPMQGMIAKMLDHIGVVVEATKKRNGGRLN